MYACSSIVNSPLPAFKAAAGISVRRLFSRNTFWSRGRP